MKHSPSLPLLLLGLAACSFDGGGVGGDDVQPIDAAEIDAFRPDADPNAPDAGPDASIDAEPDAAIDLDADDDGIVDAIDNCVQDPNTDQHDEDGDGDGDVCDNCPHVDNPGQENDGEVEAGIEADEVGDACDPDSSTRETIGLFDPFKTAGGVPDGWTSDGGTWTVSGDELHQTSTSDTTSYLYATGQTWTTMWVATQLDLDTVPPDGGGPGSEPRSAGPMVFFTPTGEIGTGFICSVFDDLDNNSDTVLFTGRHASNGTISNFGISGAIGTGDMAAGQSFVMRAEGGGGAMSCEVDSPTPAALPRTDSTYTSGTVALRNDTVAASYRYVVVFVPMP